MPSFNSDNWLSSFPKDPDGFIAWEAFALANGYVLFTVGNQAGDLADFKSAQAKAAASIAAGKPAGVLFRRGTTFGIAAINDNIQTNGLTPQLPFIVGSTFDLSNPRPILPKSFGLGNARQATQNIGVFGLDFYDPQHDPLSASFLPTSSSYEAAIRMVNTVAGGQNILVEDVRVRCMQGGLEFQDTSSRRFGTLIVRRCTVDHCWGQRWGIYAVGIRDLFVTESTFDHNGYAEPVSNWAGYPKNIFSHNLYLQEWPAGDGTDPQTRVTNCLIARAAATGCQQRSGGLNDGNLYLGNPIAGFVGATGASWQINNAVVDGGGVSSVGGAIDLSIAGQPRGWGLFLNAVPAGTISGVICINKPDAVNSGFAMSVQCNNTDTNSNVPTNATIQNCVAHGWNGPGFSVSGTPGALTFAGDDIGVLTPARNYVDSSRTTPGYARTLGIADSPSLLSAAAGCCRGNWNAPLTAASINAYIQAGFTVKS